MVQVREAGQVPGGRQELRHLDVPGGAVRLPPHRALAVHGILLTILRPVAPFKYILTVLV